MVQPLCALALQFLVPETDTITEQIVHSHADIRPMTTQTIAFIGAGNMAAALISGLIQDGYPADKIIACDPDRKRIDFISECCSVQTSDDNSATVAVADVVVLAVKPQILPQVTRELANAIKQRMPLVISIAAGIQTSHLGNWFGADVAVIRTMPNTPAMLQVGTTGLYANSHANEEQRNIAESIMRAVGITVWVKEETMMDTITAISGSGPAYFFLFMEEMIAAAEKLGIDQNTAKLLTLHTALGAARMAIENPDSPASLREKVTSPGGTTAAALDVFADKGLNGIIEEALRAARDRSIELSSQMDEI